MEEKIVNVEVDGAEVDDELVQCRAECEKFLKDVSNLEAYDCSGSRIPEVSPTNVGELGIIFIKSLTDVLTVSRLFSDSGITCPATPITLIWGDYPRDGYISIYDFEKRSLDERLDFVYTSVLRLQKKNSYLLS